MAEAPPIRRMSIRSSIGGAGAEESKGLWAMKSSGWRRTKSPTMALSVAKKEPGRSRASPVKRGGGEEGREQGRVRGRGRAHIGGRVLGGTYVYPTINMEPC